MSRKNPKMGVARTTRPCPACRELIHTGDPIAHQGREWVHASCYFDPRLKKEDAQLKDAFLATIRS